MTISERMKLDDALSYINYIYMLINNCIHNLKHADVRARTNLKILNLTYNDCINKAIKEFIRYDIMLEPCLVQLQTLEKYNTPNERCY